jgi:hypothetical protein
MRSNPSWKHDVFQLQLEDVLCHYEYSAVDTVALYF